MSNFKVQGGAKAAFHPSPSNARGCVYSVNVRVFMSWVTFT